MFKYLGYLSGAFMGWSLGANDSANVFGTAVSSRMVNYRLAVILTSVFVVAGALLQGEAGIKTLSEDLRKGTAADAAAGLEAGAVREAFKTATMISLAAAFTVTLMTFWRIPASCSQAVVGAVIGVGLLKGDVNLSGLGKVVICWVGTPVGAALITIALYWLFRKALAKWNPSVFEYDPVASALLIVCGCYGAYALGANNVANVSAIFVGDGMLSSWEAAVFGAATISAGVLTYSKPVMTTVGKGVVELNSLSAFVCVLAHAMTVHIYAMVGVPVSSSQAIVGALLGMGFIKGAELINYKMLARISLGWLSTPVIAGLASAAAQILSHMNYIP